MPDIAPAIEIEDELEETQLEGVELLADYFTVEEGGVFIPKANIAGMFNEQTLMKVGRQVAEDFDTDHESMGDWRKFVEIGLDLVKQETESRSDPWDGAANFKSPTLMNAALKFSDRASTELLRSRDISKAETFGKDENGQKAERAERVSEYQNWQLNVQMEEWREEHEKLLYDLPYTGTVFKKTFFDPTLGRNVSNLVTYPDFVVNNNVKSLDKVRRFSEEIELSGDEVTSRMRQGLWLDIELNPEETEEDDQAESDDMSTFIEQLGYFDLDNDGYQEPYTFVVQKDSQKVVRITPRFEARDVLIKAAVGIATLDKVVASAAHEVVRIKAAKRITKYGFLRDPQGGFLDVGYTHLLSALTSGINTTTNQLIDAGTLSNLAPVWLAKGFRRKMGNSRYKPGELKQTGLSARDMKDGVMFVPTREPSAALFQLMTLMIANSQELSASADLSTSLGSNAPATTTLALVQEQQLSASAIILRIYRAMSKEFSILFELNGQTGDPVEYQEVLDDDQANMEADFSQSDLDLTPVANPEISSKIQRIQQAEAELSQIQAVAAAGGDIRILVKNFFEAIGAQNVDEIFPDQSAPEQLQELLSKNPELQELILNENRRQDAIAMAQAQAMKRDQDLQEMKAVIDAAKKKSEIDVDQSTIGKNKAATVKLLEEAESEDVNNQISTYTAAQDIDARAQATEGQRIANQQLTGANNGNNQRGSS